GSAESRDRLRGRLGVCVADAHCRGARLRRLVGFRGPGLVHLREQEPARDAQRVRGAPDRACDRAPGRERHLPHRGAPHRAPLGNAELMRVVIAEFMDDVAVASLRARYTTEYDPGLTDRRDALLAAV